MEDINKLVINGRLTRDAELKYTNSGTAVTRLAIATNRGVKQGDDWTEEASFFDATLWGKRGEGLNQYLKKGQQISIDGSLKQERWEQDGQTRSRVIIHVDKIQLLGGQNQQQRSPATQNNQQHSKPQQAYNQNSNF